MLLVTVCYSHTVTNCSTEERKGIPLSIGFIFWLLMLLWLLFGLVGIWQPTPSPHYWYGHGAFLFLLFLLLGVKVFGWPIHE